MTLDSRLNWEEHIEKTRAKAKRALNIIKIVAGKKWGADRKALKKTVLRFMQIKNRLWMSNIWHRHHKQTKKIRQYS